MSLHTRREMLAGAAALGMLVALLIAVFWLAAKTKRLLFDRFLKDTGLDRSLQYAMEARAPLIRHGE